MSADANPPNGQEPTPLPGDAKFSDPLPQKRRHKKSEAGGEETTGSEGEILVLSSLLQALLAKGKQSDAAPAGPETRTRINRFAVKNTPAASPVLTAADDVAGEFAADAPSLAEVPPATAPATPLPALPKLTPRAYQGDIPAGSGSSAGRIRGTLYLAFTAAIAIAAFLVGRTDIHRTSAKVLPPRPPAVWAGETLHRLDQVLATDQSGDILNAKRLALDLRKQAGGSLPLDLYLQSLETRLGNTNEVETTLSRQLLPNPPPIVAQAINEVMAFNYDRARDFPRADESFAALTGVNPFSAQDFYWWGDTLRRKGAMPAAIEKFREALLRLPPERPELESQRECAEFKLRLAQIELGQGAQIQGAIEEHLRAPVASGYWLLTAGAAALQRGEFPAAADALGRARAALSPAMFAALTDDYFFHAYAYRAEVAGLVPPEDPANLLRRVARTGYFVDP